MNVLIWLHLNRTEGYNDGCTLNAAVRFGNIEIVKYLIENGLCGLDSTVLRSAIFEADIDRAFEIADYLRTFLDKRKKLL